MPVNDSQPRASCGGGLCKGREAVHTPRLLLPSAAIDSVAVSTEQGRAKQSECRSLSAEGRTRDQSLGPAPELLRRGTCSRPSTFSTSSPTYVPHFKTVNTRRSIYTTLLPGTRDSQTLFTCQVSDRAPGLCMSAKGSAGLDETPPLPRPKP